MEKKLCSYEALFTVIVNPSDDELHAVVNKFLDLIRDNASDVTVNEWGKRRLAYPVRDYTEGYMVLVRFKSEPSFPRELERQLRISDQLLRVMITRFNGDVAAAAPAETAAEAVAAETVAAPAAEAAPAVEAEAAPAETTETATTEATKA